MRAQLPHKLLSAAVVLALVSGACASGSGERRASAARSGASLASNASTSTSSSTTSTTGATTTTSTTAKPPPPGLGTGSKGPEVQALEQRLVALKYDAGKVDGVYDSATAFAVTAFEKVTGMPRTGRATDDVIAAMAKADDPAPLLAAGGSDRVEIDLKRQVLFDYKGGSLVRILPVSTGSGKKYCVDGECAMAITPGGSFKINRKILGVRVSKLGQLFNPLYFNGGIAIHGEPAVPSYPASHGCVRIPMNSSLWFFNSTPSGTPVYVVGGPKAPVPFNEQAPPADGSDASTTVAPSTTSAPSTTGAPSTTIAPTTTAPPPTTTLVATTTTSTTSA